MTINQTSEQLAQLQDQLKTLQSGIQIMQQIKEYTQVANQNAVWLEQTSAAVNAAATALSAHQIKEHEFRDAFERFTVDTAKIKEQIVETQREMANNLNAEIGRQINTLQTQMNTNTERFREQFAILREDGQTHRIQFDRLTSEAIKRDAQIQVQTTALNQQIQVLSARSEQQIRQLIRLQRQLGITFLLLMASILVVLIVFIVQPR